MLELCLLIQADASKPGQVVGIAPVSEGSADPEEQRSGNGAWLDQGQEIGQGEVGAARLIPGTGEDEAGTIHLGTGSAGWPRWRGRW